MKRRPPKILDPGDKAKSKQERGERRCGAPEKKVGTRQGNLNHREENKPTESQQLPATGNQSPNDKCLNSGSCKLPATNHQHITHHQPNFPQPRSLNKAGSPNSSSQIVPNHPPKKSITISPTRATNQSTLTSHHGVTSGTNKTSAAAPNSHVPKPDRKRMTPAEAADAPS